MFNNTIQQPCTIDITSYTLHHTYYIIRCIHTLLHTYNAQLNYSNHAPFIAHNQEVWIVKPKVFIIAPQWEGRGQATPIYMHHPVPQGHQFSIRYNTAHTTSNLISCMGGAIHNHTHLAAFLSPLLPANSNW